MKTIKQLKESEVIQAMVDGHIVIRVNIDKMVACDLANKTINTIYNDFGSDKYVYFIAEDIEND